jgi:hypothetical protein
MRKGNILLATGSLIFIIAYMVNRFILEISDPVYIGLLIASIIFILAGMLDIRR